MDNDETGQGRSEQPAENGGVPPEVSKYFAEIGKRGGKARLDKISPAKRKRLAKKAWQRSVEVRRDRAAAKGKGGKGGAP